MIKGLVAMVVGLVGMGVVTYFASEVGLHGAWEKRAALLGLWVVTMWGAVQGLLALGKTLVNVVVFAALLSLGIGAWMWLQ